MARKPKLLVSVPTAEPIREPHHTDDQYRKILELGAEVDLAEEIASSARATLRKKQHALTDFIRKCRDQSGEAYPLFDGKPSEEPN